MQRTREETQYQKGVTFGPPCILLLGFRTAPCTNIPLADFDTLLCGMLIFRCRLHKTRASFIVSAGQTDTSIGYVTNLPERLLALLRTGVITGMLRDRPGYQSEIHIGAGWQKFNGCNTTVPSYLHYVCCVQYTWPVQYLIMQTTRPPVCPNWLNSSRTRAVRLYQLLI